MLPTPNTTHVPLSRVYEPLEDSFLLIDTLSAASETIFLKSHFPTSSPCPLAVELGPGSGVVIAFLTAHAKTLLGRNDLLTGATDINPHACRATVETVRIASTEHVESTGSFVTATNGDLLDCWRDKSIDILLFNPPYVPTEALPPSRPPPATTTDIREAEYQEDEYFLQLAYAGGANGMETTTKVLTSLPRVLSARGVAYILFCYQNHPEEVKKEILTWGPEWRVSTVGTSGKTGGREKLSILRIWREYSTSA